MARSVGSWDGGTKTVLQPSERPARMLLLNDWPSTFIVKKIVRHVHHGHQIVHHVHQRVSPPLWSLIHVQRNKFLWCFDNMAGCVELFPSEN